MNVIFLDFDGVLNDFYPLQKDDKLMEEQEQSFIEKRECRNFIDKFMDNYPKNKLTRNVINATQMLDTEKVLLLNKIMENTDVKIVFSTSWRNIMNLEELIFCLVICGFRYPNRCIDTTSEDCWSLKRGGEISEWIERIDLNISKYAIIDDESANCKILFDEENIFKVRGLNENDANSIINHFKKER